MKFYAFIKVIRPVNCLFAMCNTFIGFWYLNNLSFYDTKINHFFGLGEFTHVIVFVCISTFLIAAGGFAINDYFDFEIDKVNKPSRPLPKGDIALQQVKIYSVILFLLGIFFAFFTRNIFCIAISIMNATSLYLYAKLLKKSFLLGNIIVSWNACSTFIYGAIISLNFKNILPLTCFAFLYTLIREWVKTIEDFYGDQRENVKSIPIVCGKDNTMRLLFLLSILLISFLYIFYFLKYIPFVLFFILGIVIVAPLFTFLMIMKKFLHNKFSESNKFEIQISSNIQKYMKLCMLIIVLVFVFNGIIYDFSV